MENIIIPLAILIVIGAFLSWLGRTPLTLIISYLVVGIVGAFVSYIGFEVFIISVVGNSYAEKINNPILLYILEVLDLKPLAAFFGIFNEEQRVIVLIVITVVSVIAATLPFVTFANAVYAAMTAEDGKKETNKVGKNIQNEIKDYVSENNKLQDELTVKLEQINSSIDLLASRIDQIEINSKNNQESKSILEQETL